MIFTDLEKGDVIVIKKRKAQLYRGLYGFPIAYKKLRVEKVYCGSFGPIIYFTNNDTLYFNNEDIFDEWFDIIELVE